VHPKSSVTNNFRFPGQYYDQETGLHYNYYRYYDPRTGRYLTPDPIGLVGGINPFAYSDNNPTLWIDPFGLARYRVYWHLKTASLFGMSAGKIEGLVISMDKSKEGLHNAIEFEGWLGGVSVGLPIGATFSNTEIFEDSCEEPDVRRVQGWSWLLSGAAAFYREGISGGGYQFGVLRGTKEDPSKAEGYDFAVDYLGGYIWTKGPIRSVQYPQLY
jgi:RHS repeat-associated protein